MAKRYWVEITKEIPHGGQGWEYGRYLWSPTEDVEGKKIYSNMTQANIGDIVVHFCEDETGKIYVDGESEVANKVIVVNTPPPNAGDWSGRKQYFKIQLKNFTKYTANKRREVKDFVKANLTLIASEKNAIEKFYPINKNGVLNQGKYLCEITQNIYNVI